MVSRTLLRLGRSSLALALAFGLVALGSRTAQAATPTVPTAEETLFIEGGAPIVVDPAILEEHGIDSRQVEAVRDALQSGTLDSDELAELADRELGAEALEDYEGGQAIVITSGAVLVAAIIVLLVLLLR